MIAALYVMRSDRPRIGHKEANETPLPFRDVLLGIARSVRAIEREEARR